MGTPTTAELRRALDRAIAMRDTGCDPDFVAKSLLNLHYRVLRLERTLEAAQRYLHSGQGALEQRLLLQALHEARLASNAAEQEDLPDAAIGRAAVTESGAQPSQITEAMRPVRPSRR